MLKTTNRHDPVISLAAAKMQMEVGRSMAVVHVMNTPENTPSEIPKIIFDKAVAEVEYFAVVNTLAKQSLSSGYLQPD